MIYRFAHTLMRIVGLTFFRHRVVHPELLPESGGALLVANHVSYLDPSMVGASFRNPIHYLARKSLFKGFLGWLLPRIQVFPVDLGKGDLSSMKRILRLLKEGNRVLIFPEGTRSPDGTLQPAEAGIGFLIAKGEVPVVPLRLFGAHECWPRKAKWPRPGRITVVAGPAVDFSDLPADLTGRERYQACADRVMEALAAIQLED
ncbi:lysophospholipid acyltransferase family protein [Geothrix sp. PMB-07]|uniref:lysophospholipid acyltransferase family protein n=1 Tax=Geothrix sp. PMB-07 TaxID=3068640 RepID=UPI002741FED6|nr:lysophospholipid acyltransferase family protein [Geothrix sp. PMB-07]WLT30842.1 lysophospholipid acyltransferase family protein [Geothrix sp. PMB-07]